MYDFQAYTTHEGKRRTALRDIPRHADLWVVGKREKVFGEPIYLVPPTHLAELRDNAEV